MEMKIINLTPHTINVVGKADFAPSGTVARVATTSKVVKTVNGIDILATEFGDVVDLPDPDQDTIYIVSRLVKSAVPNRDDLVCPGTLVRDDNGNIIGSENFSL